MLKIGWEAESRLSHVMLQAKKRCHCCPPSKRSQFSRRCSKWGKGICKVHTVCNVHGVRKCQLSVRTMKINEYLLWMWGLKLIKASMKETGRNTSIYNNSMAIFERVFFCVSLEHRWCNLVLHKNEKLIRIKVATNFWHSQAQIIPRKNFQFVFKGF